MSAQDATSHLIAALAQTVERAHEHPKAEGEDWRPPAQALTVALSREAGSLGNTVAREVGKRLGWPVYDHELLEQLAKDMRVSVHLLESIDERPGNWLQESIEALAAKGSVGEPAYFRRLVQMLLSLGAAGECLIVGRGAAQLLRPASTLRVRLLAELKDRIAVIRREMNLTEEQAVHHIETTDYQRQRFIKNHFHKDPTDPQNYDLVLNTSRFSVAACADLVIQAMERLKR